MNTTFRSILCLTLLSASFSFCAEFQNLLNEPATKVRSNESQSYSPRALPTNTPAPEANTQRKLKKQSAHTNLKDILNPHNQNAIEISNKDHALSLETPAVQKLLFLNSFRTDLKSFVDNGLLFRENTQSLWTFFYNLAELYAQFASTPTMSRALQFGHADSTIQVQFKTVYKNGLPALFLDDRFGNLPLFFATNTIDALQTILVDINHYTNTLGEKTLHSIKKLDKNTKSQILTGSRKRLNEFDNLLSNYTEGMLSLYQEHYHVVEAAPNANRDSAELFAKNLTQARTDIQKYQKAVTKKLKTSK